MNPAPLPTDATVRAMFREAARVDVLAVMATGADVLSWHAAGMSRRDNAAANLREARAAVAELIAADAEYDAARIEADCCNTSKYDQQWPRLVAAKNRRSAALTRIQGEPTRATLSDAFDAAVAK